MRIRTFVLSVMAVLALSTALTAAERTAHAGGPCSANTTMDAQEEEFLGLINDYREEHGLDSLSVSESLTQAAAWKSSHMANNDYFSHDDVGLGRDFVGRLRDCGYTANTWLAENIAAGNSSAADTFDQWRESAGHNANMLNPNMIVIGVARAHNANATYGWYWTTEFGGEHDDLAPTPTPTNAPAPPPPSLINSGDVNCVDGTTSIDAALVLQFSAALVEDLPCGGEADVDGDGRTGSIDAAIILQISANLIG